MEITHYGVVVTNRPDPKETALAALAAWSLTSRHELVAAAWRAGNRNLAELARVARVGRQAIYQDLERHSIKPTTDREEPPVVHQTPTATPVPVPGWRHPHLTSVTATPSYGGYVSYVYTVAPFTGAEPEPAIPDDRTGWTEEDADGFDARWREIKWVRAEWAKARYRRLFAALYQPGKDSRLLDEFDQERHPERYRGVSYSSRYSHPVGYSGTAGDVWRTYATARDALAAAYEAMKTQPDNQWRAGLGRIVDCTEPAKTAARDWDRVAEAFVDATQWYGGYSHPDTRPAPATVVHETGKALGLDVAGWKIAYEVEDYRSGRSYDGTAAAEVRLIIEAGQEWLRKVDQLTAGK